MTKKKSLKEQVVDKIELLSTEQNKLDKINIAKTLSILAEMSGSSEENYLAAISELSQEERTKLAKTYNAFTIGSSALTPLICPATSICPHWNKCPFAKANVVNKLLGKNCPIETSIFTETVSHLMVELNVTDSDYVKMRIIMELAEIEVLDTRITNVLSKDEHINLIKQETMFNAEGKSFEVDSISKALEIKEKLQKRRTILLNELVATPNAKVKVNKSSGEQEEIAKMRQQLRTILERASGTSGKISSLDLDEAIIDAELDEELDVE